MLLLARLLYYPLLRRSFQKPLPFLRVRKPPLPRNYRDNYPKLSPAGQAEAEARFQLVLSRHGSRLNDEDKHNIRTLCYFAQPGLERLRSFSLKNGDVPALFLKPLVERGKTPPLKRPITPAAATPKPS